MVPVNCYSSLHSSHRFGITLRADKQCRILVDSLYTSWDPGTRFLAAARIPLYSGIHEDPLWPDFFLSLGVSRQVSPDQAYRFWEFGQPPQVVMEMVAEDAPFVLDLQLQGYQRIGVAYYILFDPFQLLSDSLLRVFEAKGGSFIELSGKPLAQVYVSKEGKCTEFKSFWLEALGLGLGLWRGTVEETSAIWLRWFSANGQLLSTASEHLHHQKLEVERQRQRAKQAEDYTEKLQAYIRILEAGQISPLKKIDSSPSPC
jgi:Uma2 family endonuclease